MTSSGSKFVDYCSGRAVITGLSPNTRYEVKIAAATRSVVYPDKYFRGSFSTAVPLWLGPFGSDDDDNNNNNGNRVSDDNRPRHVMYGGGGGGADLSVRGGSAGGVVVEPAGHEPGLAAEGATSPGVLAGIVISTVMMVLLLLFLAVFRRLCDR